MYSVVYIEASKVYFEKTLYKSASLENCMLFLDSCKNKENLYVKNRAGEVVASVEGPEQLTDIVHKNAA